MLNFVLDPKTQSDFRFSGCGGVAIHVFGVCSFSGPAVSSQDWAQNKRKKDLTRVVFLISLLAYFLCKCLKKHTEFFIYLFLIIYK